MRENRGNTFREQTVDRWCRCGAVWRAAVEGTAERTWLKKNKQQQHLNG